MKIYALSIIQGLQLSPASTPAKWKALSPIFIMPHSIPQQYEKETTLLRQYPIREDGTQQVIYRRDVRNKRPGNKGRRVEMGQEKDRNLCKKTLGDS